MDQQDDTQSGIRMLTAPISRADLKAAAEERFGDMVKGVVDIEQGLLAIGGEMHADEEAFLLEKGSKQGHLWGINLYPDEPPDRLVEFDSMINIRPSQGNRSRDVLDEAIREKIRAVVKKFMA